MTTGQPQRRKRRRSRSASENGQAAAPQRTAELVETAAHLFRQRGFAATSIQDVADEMGILKGSLYHYIQTKEDLLWMIVRDPLAQLVCDARTIAADDALSSEEKLLAMAVSHGEAFEKQHPHMLVITHETGSSLSDDRQEEFNSLRQDYTAVWLGVITTGMADGEFAIDLDAPIAAYAVIGALNWMFRWYQPGGRLTGAAAARAIVEQFLNGIKSG